jgi:hypothetical protein
MAYVELQIRVEDDQNVTASTTQGAQISGKLNLSPLHRNLIEVFDYLAREKKLSRRQEFMALGSLLYESLFDSQVGAFFRKEFMNISGSDRLRLQLVFSPKVLELASLPWEFLYFPDTYEHGGFFLGTQPELVLSRFLPSDVNRPLELRGGEKPLRLLFVISQPEGEGLAPVLAAPVVAAIKDNFPETEVEVFVLDEPTINKLIVKIEEIDPHLLHYIGHGKYDPVKKEGSLALLQEGRKTPEWVPDRTLAEYFVRVQPSLVIVQACEGGTIDFGSNFAGLAPQLIRKRIPAVVAMQYPVTNKAAIDFSLTFYRQLAKGEPVDAAVQESRRLITLKDPDAYGKRDFGSPVLYMQSRDGVIMSGNILQKVAT